MKGPAISHRDSTPPLVATCGAMELSWRYAWAFFLTFTATGFHFPLFTAACILAFSTTLNRVTLKKGLVVYQVLLLNIAGFTAAALVFLHHFHYSAYPFWKPAWLSRLIMDPSNMVEWYSLLLTVFCLMMIWQGGWRLRKGLGEYLFVCLQFDKGLGLLFSLLIVNGVLRAKAGVGMPVNALGFLMPAYLIFGLASVGLSRHQHDVQRSFLSGFRGLGIIFSIAVLAVLLGSGLIFLFYPYFFPVADTLLDVLDQTTMPMVPYLVRFLRYLLVPKHKLNLSSGIEDDAGAQIEIAPLPADGWLPAVATILFWATMGGAMLMAACFMLYVLKRLFAWLLSKDTLESPPPSFKAWAMNFLKVVLAMPAALWRFCASLFKPMDSAARAYQRLLSWGRHCGLSKQHNETPDEYGSRLVRSFPILEQDIRAIVETFDREFYGQIQTAPDRVADILQAQRRMQRIRNWPRRAKVWLVS